MEKLNYYTCIIVGFEFVIMGLIGVGVYAVLSVLEIIGAQLAQIISELSEEEIER